ncbi:hypothetical protein YPPY58_2553, partial [Yersinia pestis PY-58]
MYFFQLAADMFTGS